MEEDVFWAVAGEDVLEAGLRFEKDVAVVTTVFDGADEGAFDVGAQRLCAVFGAAEES